jgi:hypothetical protein
LIDGGSRPSCTTVGDRRVIRFLSDMDAGLFHLTGLDYFGHTVTEFRVHTAVLVGFDLRMLNPVGVPLLDPLRRIDLPRAS